MNYDVTAHKAGKWWLIEIPALDGFTETRQFADIERMSKDFVATWLNIPVQNVNVSIHIVLPDEVSEHLEQLDTARQQAQEATLIAQREARAAAKELQGIGCTVREIGSILHISRQSAQQLLKSA